MLQDGMIVNVIDFFGRTALHRVALSNQTDVAKLLLQVGVDADVNKQNSLGETPLHVAALHNSPEVARLLVDKGADIKLKNYENKTPLDCARGDEVKNLLLELQ